MALRTSLVAQPHLYMGDTSGRPLDGGKVYFGQVGRDPELYPIDIFYDEALSVAAPQPVRTKGGFMYDNGDMAEIYAVETRYSVKVLDSYGRQVFYKTDMQSGLDVSDKVSSIEQMIALTGAVNGTRIYLSGTQGGTFIYDSSKANLNDGGLVFNGWVRDTKKGDGIRLSFFGVADATIDNSTLMQQALDVAYNNGSYLILDVDVLLQNPITPRVSIEGVGGNIYIDGSLTKEPITFKPDYYEDITSKKSSLPVTIKKGVNTLNGLGLVDGDTITIFSSELEVNRVSTGGVYNKASSHSVVNGMVVPAIPYNLTTANITELRLTRSAAKVAKNFNIIVDEGSLTADQNYPVMVSERSFFTLSNVEFVNKTDFNYSIGFTPSKVTHNIISHSEFDGFNYDGLGYAVMLSRASNTLLYKCKFHRVRKSLDGTFATNTIVDSCEGHSFGLHWGYNLDIINSTIQSNPLAASANTFTAGEGFSMTNCTIHMSPATTTLFAVRTDSFRMGGVVKIVDNVVHKATGGFIIEVSTGSTASWYPIDYGNNGVIMPDNLIIKDNKVVGDGVLYVRNEVFPDSLVAGAIVNYTKNIEVKNNPKDTRFYFTAKHAGADPSLVIDMRIDNSTSVNIAAPFNTFAKLYGTRLTGSLSVSAGALVNSEVRDSTVSYLDLDVSRAAEFGIKNRVTYNNCIGVNADISKTVRSAYMYYGFVDCLFERDVVIGDARLTNVVVSRGNQGVAQKFPLDGHYTAITPS